MVEFQSSRQASKQLVLISWGLVGLASSMKLHWLNGWRARGVALLARSLARLLARRNRLSGVRRTLCDCAATGCNCADLCAHLRRLNGLFGARARTVPVICELCTENEWTERARNTRTPQTTQLART